jgi:amicoumacin kinase
MDRQSMYIQAAEAFSFDRTTLTHLSKSCNEVYRFTKDKQFYILRLTKKPISYMNQIIAELDWVCYLSEYGVQASLPIYTVDGKWMETIVEGDQCLIATAFQMASGCFFDKHDPNLRGPTIFLKWGETMGRMHLLAQSYVSRGGRAKRGDWIGRKIENPHLEQGRYFILLERLRSIEQAISKLPKDKRAYGIIHNDFHPYNFHIDHGDITVFDFDDCLYGWFALDIAIAAAHAVWWGSPGGDRHDKNEFSLWFLTHFLTGYAKHNHLDSFWIEKIPMFMNYRNIDSYFWWLSDWDGDENKLTPSQHEAINYAVKLIQLGQPFDGCDIQL